MPVLCGTVYMRAQCAVNDKSTGLDSSNTPTQSKRCLTMIIIILTCYYMYIYYHYISPGGETDFCSAVFVSDHFFPTPKFVQHLRAKKMGEMSS